MPKLKFDKGAALKNIIGGGEAEANVAENAVVPEKIETTNPPRVPEPVIVAPTTKVQPSAPVAEVKSSKNSKRNIPVETKEKLTQISVYVTKDQRRTLKMRAAMSDDPKEKDISAVVRTALDRYLKNS
jgi:hypothetical protein